MKLLATWLAMVIAAPHVAAAPANSPAPWAEGGEFVAMIGDTMYEWDRDGAIAERSAIDGSPRGKRPIAGLHVNGAPSDEVSAISRLALAEGHVECPDLTSSECAVE